MRHIPELVPSRATVAATIREWHISLAAATASEQAELYACAVALAIEALTGRVTFPSLLEAYYQPDRTLVGLITAFCAEGEIPLYPHIVLGAACALHLRQIVASASS
jgi:hypothetical protein